MGDLSEYRDELGRDQPETPEGQSEANIVMLVSDRLHGRWRWALLGGAVLGLAAAVAGWRLAGVEYMARGLVQVSSNLPTLVEATPETVSLSNFGAYIASQAELMRDARVLMDAIKTEDLQPFISSLGEDPIRALSENLKVSVIRGTDLIEIRFDAEDRRLAQAAVNAIVGSYFRIYGPNAETSHNRLVQQVRTLLADARRNLADLEQQRDRLLNTSEFGVIGSDALLDRLLAGLEPLQDELAALSRSREAIEAAAAEEGRSVRSTDVIPFTEQLAIARDQALQDLLAEIEARDSALAQLEARLSPEHPQVRISRRNLQSLRDKLATDLEEAKASWGELQAGLSSFADTVARADEITSELTTIRETALRLQQERSRYAAVDRDIEQSNRSIEMYRDRLRGLETEGESIRQGRVTIRALAQLPTTPSRDRRIQYGIAGMIGGFGASLSAFFLLGSLDRRAFASRQLELEKQRFRPLGVIPDMGRLGDSDEERLLLEDCVHRVRNRLEVRRQRSESGYAIHVSSPLQGDGKTSAAASLAWSYAQAGYRTVLVDADFVGRGLTYQFGLSKAQGVSQAMQEPESTANYICAARPNLDILPCGNDTQVSAGHLQPAALRKMLAVLRARYEIIVVDSGPLTASVESLPLISTVDGVALVLRRGRSRGLLASCIEDVQHVGTAYLGVILNYATLDDCQRYSSLSRVSSDTGGGAATHPVVSALGTRQGVSAESVGTDRVGEVAP